MEVCFESILEEDPSGESKGYGDEMCSSNGPSAVGPIKLDENLEPSEDGEKHTHGLYERFRAYRLDSFLIESSVESINQDYANGGDQESVFGFFEADESREEFYRIGAKHQSLRLAANGTSDKAANFWCSARDAIAIDDCSSLYSSPRAVQTIKCALTGVGKCSV